MSLVPHACHSNVHNLSERERDRQTEEPMIRLTWMVHFSEIIVAKRISINIRGFVKLIPPCGYQLNGLHTNDYKLIDSQLYNEHKRANKQQQKRKKKVREWIMCGCTELYSWWGKILIINKNFRAWTVYKEDMEFKQSGLTRKTSFRFLQSDAPGK